MKKERNRSRRPVRSQAGQSSSWVPQLVHEWLAQLDQITVAIIVPAVSSNARRPNPCREERTVERSNSPLGDTTRLLLDHAAQIAVRSDDRHVSRKPMAKRTHARHSLSASPALGDPLRVESSGLTSVFVRVVYAVFTIRESRIVCLSASVSAACRSGWRSARVSPFAARVIGDHQCRPCPSPSPRACRALSGRNHGGAMIRTCGSLAAVLSRRGYAQPRPKPVPGRVETPVVTSVVACGARPATRMIRWPRRNRSQKGRYEKQLRPARSRYSR